MTTNVAAQRVLPWWVRARGLGMYMLVLAGGIADRQRGVGRASPAGASPPPIVAAAATLLAGTATARRWKLGRFHGLDLRPAQSNTPMVTLEPEPTDGPVLVTVSYRVPESGHAEFAEMMRGVERDRRRSGAEQWGLFRDLADTDLFVETFVVSTWIEHLRQHQRRTVNADVMLQRAREFVEGPVTVAHLISVYSTAGLRPVEDCDPDAAEHDLEALDDADGDRPGVT